MLPYSALRAKKRFGGKLVSAERRREKRLSGEEQEGHSGAFWLQEKQNGGWPMTDVFVPAAVIVTGHAHHTCAPYALMYVPAKIRGGGRGNSDRRPPT